MLKPAIAWNAIRLLRAKQSKAFLLSSRYHAIGRPQQDALVISCKLRVEQRSQPSRYATNVLLCTNISARSINSSKRDRYYGSSSSAVSNRMRSHQGSVKEGRSDIANLTRQLISEPIERNTSSVELYRASLKQARTDLSFLKSLGLTPSDAESMYIMPPSLLNDIHSAISHFSKRENYQGIVLDSSSAGAEKYNKIPGPIICARLLELIGIPHYYTDLAAKLGSAPLLIVHSSQIDHILHCCLQTTLVLSNSCKTGKQSLLGFDFNYIGDWQPGEKKTAAHLCEGIWRHISNTEIKFTFERAREKPAPPPVIPMISNPLLASAMEHNPLTEYLNAGKSRFHSSLNPWSNKDQRRYKQAMSLFNSTLAAFARSGSSATGIRHELRKDMVQSAERMLLDLAAKNTRVKPSPSTILQCTQPDVISFNTAMNAWAQLNPRIRGGNQDENSVSIAALTAERIQAILEMMQELWDEEETTLSTKQAFQSTWEEYGDGKSYQPHVVYPNTSSYNTVLSAWSRSGSDDSIDNAMQVFQMMVGRCNRSRDSRVSLILQNSRDQRRHAEYSLSEGYRSCPDSRTFVALLGCCSNVRSKGFNKSVALIENIHETMKHWDGQLQWSMRHGISLDALSSNQDKTHPIINVFTYNALIHAYASITKSSWEENLQCCYRIDEIVSHMNTRSNYPDVITRGTAIDAWIKCADFAPDKQARKKLCEKACAHLDLCITQQSSLGGNASRLVHSLCDVIAFCGKSSMPSKANELFLRAKECSLNTLQTYCTTIDALAQSSEISDIDTALKYSLELGKEKLKNNSNISRSNKHDFTWMYNAIISGYVNSKQSAAGCDKAHELLLHMIDNARNPMYIGQANTTSFALVMDALAQRGRTKEVEVLLSKLEQLEQLKSADVRGRDSAIVVEPNINHYNILMTSYLRSNTDSDFESAQKLFSRMRDDTTVPSPDAITNSMLVRLKNRNSAPSKEGVKLEPYKLADSDDDLDATNDSNSELNYVIRNTIRQSQSPTSGTFNTVKTFESFNTIMKKYNDGTIEGAEKATALLRRMEELYVAGDINIRPDTVLYNLALNAWQQCEKNSSVTSSISPSAKAEEILQLLCNRYRGGNRDVVPNDASFSICIHSWCSSSEPGAAERAEGILRLKEEFLDQIDGLTIRTTDYNSIFSKWGKDDPDNGHKHASALFEAMRKKSNEDGAYQAPNEFSFNTMLSVFAKSNDDKGAEHAEGFLREMDKLFDEKKTSVQPSMISYRTVINAHISRKHTDAPRRVEALVDDLARKSAEGRDNLKADSTVLDLILKACNLVPRTWKEKSDTKIIEIANRTFTKIRANSQQTHSTYAFMFRIFNRHMNFNDPRYDLLMTNLWKEACRDGLVSEFTLESLRLSVKESTFFDCIGRWDYASSDSVKVSSLDFDWRRNVAAKRQSNSG